MKNIFWFRRDLRLHDNHGLYRALIAGFPVQPIFIYDRQILDLLEPDDARVQFLVEQLMRLEQGLRSYGSSLWVMEGDPVQVFEQLIAAGDVREVFANEDYEPYGIRRDQTLAKILNANGITLNLNADHLIMPPGRVLKEDGTPYTVFTPFMKRWKLGFKGTMTDPFPDKTHFHHLLQIESPASVPNPSGFTGSTIKVVQPRIEQEILTRYHETRDRPDLNATSFLGPHLRFGTVSVRQVVNEALHHSETFLNELIWREFFAHILYHYPEVEAQNFRKGFDHFPWRNDPNEIERWMTGTTGFPMVDAGMRQLVQTGWMHNRVRMITASFLVKDLLVDWRIGEAFFARHLLDFELASNNGNWQWAAGTGCDAAPFFRIFNPAEQQRKFDPDMTYIRKWIPEFGTARYPLPMIDHAAARNRALKLYKEMKKV